MTSRLKNLLLTFRPKSGTQPANHQAVPGLTTDRARDMAPITEYEYWHSDLIQRMRLKEPYLPDEVVVAVEAYLGCTIEITTEDWEGSTLYGACCPTGEARYLIALRQGLTARQRAKTIYHELAHILRGHVIATEAVFRGFEPTTRQDIEAEEIARLFLERGSQGRRQSFNERFIERMGGVN